MTAKPLPPRTRCRIVLWPSEASTSRTLAPLLMFPLSICDSAMAGSVAQLRLLFVLCRRRNADPIILAFRSIHVVFRFLQGTGVRAGRQILPSGVGDHERDVGALACLYRLCRHASAACRTAPVEMPAKMPSSSISSRVRLTASREPTENRVVSTSGRKLGDEALVDVAQAVDEFPVPGLGGHDLDVGHVLARSRPGPSACRWCRGRRRSA